MSSFGKSRTKKMMMKRETAKKKRAKKKTTRATQSAHRVTRWFVLVSCFREHRHNKSRQAQILERGASHAAIIVRHNTKSRELIAKLKTHRPSAWGVLGSTTDGLPFLLTHPVVFRSIYTVNPIDGKSFALPRKVL